MFRILLTLSFFMVSCSIIFSQSTSKKFEGKDFEKIKALMKTQSESWNRGDIEGFMQTYWKSENLQFIGSQGVTYGWQQTLEGYKKRYPDKATMGYLTFDLLEMDKRSKKVISVVGKWHLKRPEKGDIGGHFLLILQKIHGNWMIVADHSS